MSAWNHSICVDCWNVERPDKKVTPTPERPFDQGPVESCCFCGVEHCSGIYLRKDPSTVPCCQGHAS